MAVLRRRNRGIEADGGIYPGSGALALLIGAVLAIPAMAYNHGSAGAPSQTLQYELVAQTGGDIAAIRLVGDTAWAGVGPRLVAIDTEDLSQPRIIGRTDVLPSSIVDVAIPSIEPNGTGGDPELAYVALASFGLAVIDIRETTDPVMRSLIELEHAPRYVAAVGDSAWVLTKDETLVGIDASDPQAPRQVVEFPVPGGYHAIMAMAAVPGHLVLALYEYAAPPDAPVLYVIDVRAPSSPAVVGILAGLYPADPTYISDMVVSRGIVWLLGENPEALVAVDVRDPTRPQVISGFAHDEVSMVFRLVVADGIAYLFGGDGGHNWYRVSMLLVDDPVNIRLLGHDHLPLETDPSGAAAAMGTTLWLGFDDGHLLALDASSPHPEPYPMSDMPVVGGLHMVGPLQLLEASARLGLGALHESVVSLDLDDPSNPGPLGRALVSYYPRSIEIVDRYAFVATLGSMDLIGEELHVLNLSDPRDMKRVGPSPAINASRVSVDGDVAAVIQSRSLAWDTVLRLVEATNPAAPTLGGTLTDDRGFQDVLVTDDVLYGLTPTWLEDGEFALVIADASDLSAPAVLSEVDLGPPAPERTHARLDVAGGIAYAVTYGQAEDRATVVNQALHVVDVRDPAAPAKVAHLPLPSRPESVAYAAGHLFLATVDGVTVVDVREPWRPSILGAMPTGREGALDATVVDGLVYAAAGNAGLYVFRPDLQEGPKATISSVPPSPTPANTDVCFPTSTSTTTATPDRTSTCHPSASPSATTGGSATPLPTGTPTARASATSGPAPRACGFILNRVPTVAVQWALANPERVYGWDQLTVPGLPPSPANTRKHSLSIRNVAMPYDADFNPLVYKSGCP